MENCALMQRLTTFLTAHNRTAQNRRKIGIILDIRDFECQITVNREYLMRQICRNLLVASKQRFQFGFVNAIKFYLQRFNLVTPFNDDDRRQVALHSF